jgi:NAD-dependent SIR2 family protein deacetylase
MDKKERIVFILGAGFSAPAKLPIQDRILQEMIKKPAADFLTYTPEPESTKFLKSYITVGLFLLQNYTAFDCAEYNESFEELELKSKYTKLDISVLSEDTEKNELLILREKIRDSLEKSKIHVSLEDVFTSFDKTYQSREYFHRYSSQYVDEIKESITRLFVYYFSKRCKNHTYVESDYLSFFSYLKNHATNSAIISTNWDVLTETYLEKQKLVYDLSLNDTYYTKDGLVTSKSRKTIKLIKIHGSINWFRCLNCGKINIVNSENCGNYLFDDKSQETCKSCRITKNADFLLQSQIITPTMMKSLNSQLYTNLWSSARETLLKADHVYFVGYSLPIADFDFRYLLHQSISDKAKIDVILYHDDDPKQTKKTNLKDLLPEKRYHDLFAKNQIEFHYDGFGAFFKKQINNLS